jgi:hypothetical protein
MTTQRVTIRPPIEVIGACGAIVVAAVVACIWDRIGAELAGRPFPRDVFVIAVLAAMIIWGLLRRQNWLRIFISAWYLVAFLGVVLNSIFKGIGALPTTIEVHSAIQVVAAVLLMLPASQEWFVPRQSVGNLSAIESVMLWISGTLIVILFVVAAMAALSGRGVRI